jgi:hypothetical protein
VTPVKAVEMPVSGGALAAAEAPAAAPAPAAKSGAAPSPLSQHLARSLRATYGAKAEPALGNTQRYGYLVD